MSSKTTKKKKIGVVWDAKGPDVPTGRFTRSVMKGTTRLTVSELEKVKKSRHKTLNLVRAIAGEVEDENERSLLWQLIGSIGYNGQATWNEVMEARTEEKLIALARRGERHIEAGARRERDARNSELRTCSDSVKDYLGFRLDQSFSPFGDATAESVLRRALAVKDPDGVAYSARTVVGLGFEDADLIESTLARSDRLPDGRTTVDASTREKNQRTLRAWFNWEMQKERERASDQKRTPLYHENVFDERGRRYSKPSQKRHQTVREAQESRRFFPEEIRAMQPKADFTFRYAIPVIHCLGLRPGELTHLRWLTDVRPLDGGAGYIIQIQGGRGLEPRCSCLGCKTPAGWAPKNGPREYHLNRSADQIGWIGEACDALDEWVALTKPARNEFLFPSPHDRARAMSNQELNQGIREAGQRAGVAVGKSTTGKRTAHSFRHACSCDLLERGVPHALAATWIGDTLQTFMDTYGRPTPEQMARVTLAGIRNTVQRNAGFPYPTFNRLVESPHFCYTFMVDIGPLFDCR
jgi:integrase